MTGYDVVGEQIKEYWKSHHICDVVVLILVDGSEVETVAFCESDSDPEHVTFLDDFWEGEEDVRVQKIKPLYEVLEIYRKLWRKIQ